MLIHWHAIEYGAFNTTDAISRKISKVSASQLSETSVQIHHISCVINKVTFLSSSDASKLSKQTTSLECEEALQPPKYATEKHEFF
jgi:hypothetical protein